MTNLGTISQLLLSFMFFPLYLYNFPFNFGMATFLTPPYTPQFGKALVTSGFFLTFVYHVLSLASCEHTCYSHWRLLKLRLSSSPSARNPRLYTQQFSDNFHFRNLNLTQTQHGERGNLSLFTPPVSTTNFSSWLFIYFSKWPHFPLD